MQKGLLLIVLLIVGCQGKSLLQQQPWSAEPIQIIKAKDIAEEYAVTELRLSNLQLSKMKTKSISWKEGEMDVIQIYFYNPNHHQNWKDMPLLRGGFPDYFTISVDVNSETVINHYASEE